MSRSNQEQLEQSGAKNPCARWFEWSNGEVKFFDKARGERIVSGLPFSFLLLDKLSDIGGWHNASSSGIYSNAVRDTRRQNLVVRAFKGGTIAEGLYVDIKDQVKTAGGRFQAVLYLGYKDGDSLRIGALKLRGAALSAWMEFEREHRHRLFESAIVIAGCDEGRKGSIVYRVPKFELRAISAASASEATALDRQLQEYLTEYFRNDIKTKPETASEQPARILPPEYPEEPVQDIYEEDIPF